MVVTTVVTGIVSVNVGAEVVVTVGGRWQEVCTGLFNINLVFNTKHDLLYPLLIHSNYTTASMLLPYIYICCSSPTV